MPLCEIRAEHLEQSHRLALELSRRLTAVPNLRMPIIHCHQIANGRYHVVLKHDDDVADPSGLSHPDISQIARPKPTTWTRNPQRESTFCGHQPDRAPSPVQSVAGRDLPFIRVDRDI